jgi:hypothetical protein
MWHSGTGTIIYDPWRGEMKRRTKNWAVVDVDREITRYYRWWVMKEKWIELYQPSWDAHISIVRGERLPNPEFWKKYHGRKIEFKYKHEVRRSGDTTGNDRPDHYWFVEVDAPFLNEIRTELGLVTGWKFHLTIGRTYD